MNSLPNRAGTRPREATGWRELENLRRDLAEDAKGKFMKPRVWGSIGPHSNVPTMRLI